MAKVCHKTPPLLLSLTCSCLQMASYVVVAASHRLGLVSTFLSLLRLQAPSQSRGLSGHCVVKDLTASTKVALETGLQLSVAVAMVLLYWCGKLFPVRYLAGRFGLHRSSFRVRQDSTQPCETSSLLRLDTVVASTGVLDQGNETPPTRTRRVLVVSAAVNFGLTAYASLTVATMSLLQCVWVRDTTVCPPYTPCMLFRLLHRKVLCGVVSCTTEYVALHTMLVTDMTGPRHPNAPAATFHPSQRCVQLQWMASAVHLSFMLPHMCPTSPAHPCCVVTAPRAHCQWTANFVGLDGHPSRGPPRTD